MSAEHERDDEGKSGVALARKVKVERPKPWKILMHNDDYTTMEFVVYVLQQFFQKTRPEAQAIMLQIHTAGVGLCGIFTFEVAESKKEKVMKYAREQGHPLKLTIEQVDD